MITQEYLKSVLNYDPDTGIFTWINKTGKSTPLGKQAGCKTPKGYILIRLGKTYLAHRLAWLYVYGEWPRQLIDHIDGNTNNNSIYNLRDVSVSDNGRNQKRHRGGKLVGCYKSGSKFMSLYDNKYLGTFNTEREAHEAYINRVKAADGERVSKPVNGIILESEGTTKES